MLLVSLTFYLGEFQKIGCKSQQNLEFFYKCNLNLQHNLEIWVSRQLKYELSNTKNLRGKATQAFKYMSMHQGLDRGPVAVFSPPGPELLRGNSSHSSQSNKESPVKKQ